MADQEIPRQEIEAAFKAIKKEIDGSIIKVYNDGSVKIVDNAGVMYYFETYEEFLVYAHDLQQGAGAS